MSDLGKNCVTDALLVRALDGELPPRKAWLVKLHLESCESCQTRLEGLRQILSRVVELHHVPLPQDAAGRFGARLAEEESQEQRVPVWRRWLTRPTWRRLAWCAVLAVVALVGLRMWTARPHRPVQPVIRPVPAARTPPASKQLLAAGVAAKPAELVHRGVKKRARRAAAASEAVAASEEFATPFFALPFSDAALPLDQAVVIRVELPRSALTLAGLPVDEDWRNECVQADLVLGADGLARAIRFVE